MPQRHALRLGGATAIIGGVFTFVGNIFHPREPGQLDSAANLFNLVVHHPMWVADHLISGTRCGGWRGMRRPAHTRWFAHGKKVLSKIRKELDRE